MRPGEGAHITTCNLSSDFKGLKQFLDGSTLVTTNICKNDEEHKGHWMRFGKSQDPELDINHQLGLFMDPAGTRPDPSCQAAALRCPKCKPLFPKLARCRLTTPGSSGERSDACRAERSQLRSRKRALRDQATPVWRAGHDPGRRPGDWASDNLPRRSRPARWSSAGSRPQVTAVTAPVTAFTAPVTATESGQRVQNPRRRRPPEQRLSPSHSKA